MNVCMYICFESFYYNFVISSGNSPPRDSIIEVQHRSYDTYLGQLGFLIANGFNA